MEWRGLVTGNGQGNGQGHVLTSNILLRRLILLAKLLSLSKRLAKRLMAMVTAGYCMPPANWPNCRKVLSE